MFDSLRCSLEMSRHVREHGSVNSLDTDLPGPSEVQLGEHLRQLRLICGLELNQLAKRTGLSVDVLDALERGRHGADVATLRRWAAGLGVGVGMIFALWERRGLAGVDGDP
jgi:DNA-binding XRE family transcriptional regulator